MEDKIAKIYVILTGGTICSVPDANGINHSDASKVQSRLTKYYSEESDSEFRDSVKFKIKSLKHDILSENMTANVWGELLRIFREEIDYGDCRGIIVLHGTDTLAYTSAFLSFALAGIKVPVCMVSAHRRLGEYVNGEWVKDEDTNGYANFRAAVELIMNRIAANVYAVYRNEDNRESGTDGAEGFFVHYGAHLLQCPNSSNDFHSRYEMKIPDIKCAHLDGEESQTKDCLYKYVENVGGEVLMLRPYTNLKYSAVKLCRFGAVIHGTYHSESVCIGRASDKARKGERAPDNYKLSDIVKKDKPYSILYLLKKCRRKNIPVFLAPCDEKNARYGTTANARNAGALPIGSSDITLEAAYAKAVLWFALKKEKPELKEFLGQEINFEFNLKKENA